MSAKGTGCHKNTSGPKSANAGALREKLDKYNLKNLNNLSARLQLSINQGGQLLNANANLIWMRDSMVWMNVKKFGLEAARILITKDSVFLLNRLEKTYQVHTLEYLQTQYQLPAGFDLIQSIILAKAWLLPEIPLQADIDQGMQRLSGNDSRYIARYWMEIGSHLLQKESFVQKKDSKMVSIDFGSYQKIQGAGTFPHFRKIEAFDPDFGAMFVEATLSDVEINSPVSYKFEIPAHYKRTE